MTEFRTPEEMNEISENSEPGQPYVLEYEVGPELLVFFGSVHSSNPDHPQWPALDGAWQKFLDHQHDKKMVFYEGNRPESVEGLTEEQALQKLGESGLVLHRAQHKNIPAESPEPDRKAEAQYLLQQFSIPEVITYYFARQMLQWNKQDKELNPKWQPYARQLADKLNSLDAWDGQEIKLGHMFAWFKQVSKKSFDPNDEETLYGLSDPAQSPVSAASGRYRDEKLFAEIQRKLAAGSDIFVVYGSGHAISLEPALQKLAGQNGGEL